MKFIPMKKVSQLTQNYLDIEEIHLDNSNLEITNKLIYKNSLKNFQRKTTNNLSWR